ncbi:MAG: Hsp70 family protein [Gammaproteobacteria bacterium]
MNDTIIGIDLGTTNSEVAIVENGKVQVIADAGNKILPSFVGIGDAGEILVGEMARNQYLLYPQRTVKSIKRLMGQEVPVAMAGQAYSPQEISAIILKRLKAIAENYLGKSVHQAVITVPAYFSDAQRRATREAGEIAGLEVVRMINEPTAAALVYGAGHAEAKRMLVFDLGGGTFDVSVVSVQDSVVEVLSTHGDNHLGGDDFDQLIAQHILSHVRRTHGIEVEEHSKAMARIVRAAEQAKLVLSDEPYTQIAEEYLLEQKGVPVHLMLELARSVFEDMIGDYLDATMEATQIALKGANLTASDIDEIILVGGSTRTPCIRERLFNEFGIEPHGEVDPDLCVAMGAAMQAAMMAGQPIDAVLVDVTPYTYGTSAMGYLDGMSYPYRFFPIIHKNSVLPAKKSEAFMTHQDGQPMVDVRIFQGEDPDALNNIEIGEFKIEGLQDAPAGNVITVTLELDLNGILQVSAREKATGKEKSITINNAISRFAAEALAGAKQRIEGLFGETGTPASTLSDEARKVIAKAKSLLDTVSAEDKEDIVDLIYTLSTHIESGNNEALGEPLTRLKDILYYIEN